MGWTTLGMGGQSVVRLVVLVILARLVSPADFGIISAALSVITFIEIFSQASIGPAIVHRDRIEARHLRTALGLAITIGTVTGIGIWFLAGGLAALLRMPDLKAVLRVLAALILTRSPAVVAEAQLYRELQFRFLANSTIAVELLGYGAIGVILAKAGWGVWALVAALYAQALLRTCVLLVRCPPALPPLPDWRTVNELMRFGGGSTAATIANEAAQQADKIAVGRWLGPVALGWYGRAYQLMEVPVTFGELLDRVLFPTMVRLQHEDDRLAPAYLRAAALSALVVGPLTIVSVLFAPELIALVLGPNWKGVVPPFQLLAWGMFFRIGYKLSKSVVRAKGAVLAWAWRQWIWAAAVIVGALVGQHWGVVGVAASVILALGLNYFLMLNLSIRLTGLSWRSFAKAHEPALVLSLVSGSVLWVIASPLRRTGMSPFPVLLLASSILAAWLLFLVWLLPERILGREGLWMLRHVQDYVPDGWGRSVQRPVAEGSSITHEEAESLRAGVSTATE